MVVSPSARSEGAGLHNEEETPNLGTGNQVENEVINVEDGEDARADVPSGKRGKKTTSECWDHFYKTTKMVEVDGKKVVEQWAKCKYCNYEGRRNSRNGTTVFLNHIKMHSVKSGQQLLKLEKKEPDSVSVETFRYDQEKSLKKFRLSIVRHLF
jgi:predicted Zn-ribbon and HTH transcriptional regulator